MIINLPFYKNDADGNRCAQICGKIVLKHFFKKDFSLKELDNLMGRKSDMWTYTSQLAGVLFRLGLDVKMYSKEALEPFLEGEPFIRRHFGKDADKILTFTDIPVVVESIKKLLDYNLFKKKKISINEIEEYIKKNYVLIVIIDDNKIIGKSDFFQGHVVVITGFDDKHIYYHDSGPSNPTPNKKVEKKIFVKAMDANGTDNDCIIVFGKK